MYKVSYKILMCCCSDQPVSADNLVLVLLFSKIMAKDLPCNKGKY